MSRPTGGLILAGGQGRRLGGRDKALIALGGRPLLAHVMDRLAPQCDLVLVSANGDPGRFAPWPVPVVADAWPDFRGPLAGILAGLDCVAASRPDIPDLVSISVDTPFLPPDLVERLTIARALGGTDLACAASGGRRHPVAALWRVGLRDTLRAALSDRAGWSVDAVLREQGCAEAEWADRPCDPFFNINRPQDLEEAHRLLRRQDQQG